MKFFPSTEQYRRELIIRQREKSESKTTDQATTENSAAANFFADMEPQNVRQAKLFVGANSSKQDSKNRLSVSMDEAYQPVVQEAAVSRVDDDLTN